MFVRSSRCFLLFLLTFAIAYCYIVILDVAAIAPFAGVVVRAAIWAGLELPAPYAGAPLGRFH